MEKLRTNIRRLYFRVKHDYLSLDNVVFFIAIIACVAWTYSSLSATSRNWELSQKLSKKKMEYELLEFEIETEKMENAYYRSAEYQELSIRSKQNKMFEGEKLVYLPENSEEACKKYQETDDEVVTKEPSNFSQWMSFLFGT